MLTLYHAPRTRSSRLVTLVDELGALDAVEIKIVSVQRFDGSGARDLGNPHPEGKVPYLIHDGAGIWESVAIAQYLTELFPEARLAPEPGDGARGPYLSWLAWYAGVVEPVVVLNHAGITNPALDRTFRGMDELTARLRAALEDAPYLTGACYTSADLIIASLYGWMPSLLPDVKQIRDWAERCNGRGSVARTMERDAQLLSHMTGVGAPNRPGR